MFPNLRAEMAREGLTGVALAKKIGISEATFRSKMSRRSEFTLSEMLKIKHNCFPNCSLEYLFSGEAERTA